MTYDEAIASLLETCENLKEAIERLQEENAFLTETIENNNLDKIVSERRSLLNENEQCIRNADIAIVKANQIKLEYESKMVEVDKMFADAIKKQTDINSYIKFETEKRINNIKSEYEAHKMDNDNALKNHKMENDKQMQETINFYKEKNKKLFIITLISVILAIGGIVINFM